jgi:hypothetical protein
VGKRPCGYELIAEFVHCENLVIEPDETVDLRQRGLKGFITAHKEFVTIFIGGPEHPYRIERTPWKGSAQSPIPGPARH